jgi:hypothetical protein
MESRIKLNERVVAFESESLCEMERDFAPSPLESVIALLQLPEEQVAVSLAAIPVPESVMVDAPVSQAPDKVGVAETVAPLEGLVTVRAGPVVSFTTLKEVELLLPAVSVEVTVMALLPSPEVRVTV